MKRNSKSTEYGTRSSRVKKHRVPVTAPRISIGIAILPGSRISHSYPNVLTNEVVVNRDEKKKRKEKKKAI